jgi:threonyl-tRNA synthetase
MAEVLFKWDEILIGSQRFLQGRQKQLMIILISRSRLRRWQGVRKELLLNSQISVLLPDGSQRFVNLNASVGDVAASIGPGLLKASVAGKINGKIVDLSHVVSNGDKVEIITASTPEGLEVIRHSTAHVMAMAIQDLFPGTQITFGPVVENQFYYDVYPPEGSRISSDDFEKIEKRMSEIAVKDTPVNRVVMSREEAKAHFLAIGEKFKAEIVDSIPAGDDISVYKIGEWGDLCRGPHVPSTGKCTAFKLMSLAGAYWRANKDNEQLTRVYGTAWSNKKELDGYLHMLEEAKKRDHVLLGKQLELFTLMPDVAVGAPFFLPNGAKLFILLQNYIRRKCAQFGFREIFTPQVMNTMLWKISGHYDNYRENMYFTKVDDMEYGIKPMSCPAHVRLFMSAQRSYRDLPLRFAEFGVVHRHELHGAVHGLTRVRRITQDDGHIFCMLSQVVTEIRSALQLVQEAYKDLGFDEVKYYLSTRPEKRLGSEEVWDLAEKSLEDALNDEGIKFILNAGDGAFYGPKIDFKVRDAIGRYHQCATIQLDFQMPGRFGATFMSAANVQETPVMIHRAVLGSVERFMGVFIEHCAGHFPVGLAPIQARLINVTDAQLDYVKSVEAYLFSKGVRIESDLDNEKLGFKIRNAQLKKIPYMLVVGDKEKETGMLQPRLRDGKNLDPMTPEQFYEYLKKESGVFWGLDVNQQQ